MTGKTGRIERLGCGCDGRLQWDDRKGTVLVITATRHGCQVHDRSDHADG